MVEKPELYWHGGHTRLMAGGSFILKRMPGRAHLGRVLAHLAVAGARALQRYQRRFPARGASLMLASLDKVGLLGGHLMYEGGGRERTPSEFLGRRLRRE